MIPRTHRERGDWLQQALTGVEAAGVAIVEGVLRAQFAREVRDGLRAALAAVERRLGASRLAAAGERGVVRLPMLTEPVFYRLLEAPEVLAVVDATVSDTAVLHLQNGLLLPPEESPETLFQNQFHRDFRRVLNGYLCSINTLFAVDEFTATNGATRVVPGSHQREIAPSVEEMEQRAVALQCGAGAMIVFDSTLWHAAGRNRSASDRAAVNQQFTRSYFKPQIDYVRALPVEALLAQAPRTQQLLGWYSRVPASLEEYYQPPERRLYRAGQG